MQSAPLRILAVAATVLGIAGAARAQAQPAPHVMRPRCVGDLAVRVLTSAASDEGRRVIAVISRTSGAPCVVAGFPELAFAGPPRAKTLPAARLSVAQNATIGNGTVAAFAVRYSVAPAVASPAPSPEPAADSSCSLAVLVDGFAARGTVALPVPCAALEGVAISSFAPGSSPPDEALATPAPGTAIACRPQDLDLRDVGPDPVGGALRERYAVQNVGLGPCRVAGNVGVVLRDARGAAIPLAPGRRVTLAPLLTLARGHDASFDVAYPGRGPNGEQRCVAAATIAVTIPGGATPVIAATHIVPCPPATGPGIHVSNLQPGIPLPAP